MSDSSESYKDSDRSRFFRINEFIRFFGGITVVHGLPLVHIDLSEINSMILPNLTYQTTLSKILKRIH